MGKSKNKQTSKEKKKKALNASSIKGENKSSEKRSISGGEMS